MDYRRDECDPVCGLMSGADWDEHYRRGALAISSRVVSPQVPPSDVPVKPRVSVVIVSYNCEEALRRCVQALEASRGREQMEILTVDAGSEDGSPRIDSEFPAVTVMRLPRNFGKTRARNIGVRTAQADLLLFLDPHVEVDPGTVLGLADLLDSREDASAAGAALRDEAGQKMEIAFRLPSSQDLAPAAMKGTPLPRVPAGESAPAVEDHAVMVRRVFLAGMNYLDEKRFSEYWSFLEVCWQIRNAGKKILLAEAGATLHEFTELDVDETSYDADRISGAASYIGKHEGMGAAISFKLKCFFSALGSARLGLAMAVATGQRLDPTQ